MEWEGKEESGNVEDRRGMGMKAGAAIGGGGIIIALVAMFLGVDPAKLGQLINPGGGGAGGDQQQVPGKQREFTPREQEAARFSKIILKDTEDVWDGVFERMGKRYEKPVLILYTDQTDTACGFGQAAMGPFYCPGDFKVYLDLSFFDDMETKLRASGKLAQAYVIAHEVGHHVQRLLGTSAKVDAVRRTGNKVEANKMSVRLELQADFYAGVWAHYAKDRFKLTQSDLESALNAANKIGDDTLMKNAGRAVVPDAFTHGSSKQRMRWFFEGFKTGDFARGSQLFSLPYEDL